MIIEGYNIYTGGACELITYRPNSYIIEYITFCRAKHPVKVHVWAGISKRGRTGICIFEGIMDAPLYIKVLNQTLLPFLGRVYLDGHCSMADNDSKHTSNEARIFLFKKE